MYQIVSLLIVLISFSLYAQPEDPKKPAIEMFMESSERFTVLKSILNRSFLRYDHVGSGSGVFIGTNEDNIGLVLSAAHVIRQRVHSQEEAYIPGVDGIPRSEAEPEKPLHLKEYLFGHFFSDSDKKRQRIAVPYYSPAFDFSQDNFIWEDFSLALVGHRAGDRETVTEYFTNPSRENPAPNLEPLVVASPVFGEDLISIGGLTIAADQKRMLEAFDQGSKESILNAREQFKEHYAFAKVADYDQGWSLFNRLAPDSNFDPEVEFYMFGDVADQGMSGGGVYNLRGQLVGLITHVMRDETSLKTKVVRAVRADYIIKSIWAKSKNPEVLKSLENTKVHLTCNAYL